MLEIEKLSKRSGNTDASITNRIQEMEDRISNVEDTIEEIDSSVKENTKSKKVTKQNVQEIWDTMKRPNLQIEGIEEGKEYQRKGFHSFYMYYSYVWYFYSVPDFLDICDRSFMDLTFSLTNESIFSIVTLRRPVFLSSISCILLTMLVYPLWPGFGGGAVMTSDRVDSLCQVKGWTTLLYYVFCTCSPDWCGLQQNRISLLTLSIE
ncbi:hypothetical protein STEG23_030239, partial [Scotinomys teguina]